MFALLDRYIFREVLTPFALTLGALILILLMDQLLRLTELLINKGITFLTIAKIFVSILPPFLVIAIPASVLIGMIIAFSRLSTDGEVTAFKAAGVSLYRLLRSPLIFAVLTFALTFSLSIWAQPWAGRSLKNLAVSIFKQQASVGLEAGTFNEPFENMVVYVEQMPTPDTLKGVLIYDLRDPETPVLTLAGEGIVMSDPKNGGAGFRLLDGSQHRINRSDPDRHQLLRFGVYEFKLNLDSALKSENLQVERVRPEELKKAMAEKPEQAARYRELLVEYYRNYTLPFSCLIFGLLGVPLGITVKQAGRLGGFALGLLTAAVYYILIILADLLSTSGTMSPLLAAWFPNGIMAVAALISIVKVNRGFGW
jgi:lipopolysaccharide export system permease protein